MVSAICTELLSRSWVPDFRTLPRQVVFLTPVDSDFHEFLQECHSLALHSPTIIASIYEDLELHSKRKKLQRLADEEFLIAQTPPLPGVEFVTPARKVADLTLATGRPRTDAYVAFLFLMLRGNLGGCKDQKARLYLTESMTLRFWLEPLGIELPCSSTLSEILNAISNETRTLILKEQMKKIFNEGLDDFQEAFVDSTSVEANSDRPTDSSLMVKLASRILTIGRKFHQFSLPNMDQRGMQTQLQELSQMSQRILFLNGKSRCESKRKTLYYKIIRRVRRLSKRLGRELSAVQDHFLTMPALLPSRHAMAQMALDQCADDLKMLLKTADAAEKRVLAEEKVCMEEKVISISDKDAGFIVKGGWNSVVGYRPQITRSGSGFVTSLHVPLGNAADSPQLVSMIRMHIENTKIKPRVVSADDGYSSMEGRNTLLEEGIEIVSISGAKGKKITGDKIWKSSEYRTAREQRSAIESLMFTLKFNHDFGQMSRREKENVEAEMLEKILAHNICQIMRIRRIARKVPGVRAV